MSVSEADICKAFVRNVYASRLAWKSDFLLIHIANERKCTPKQGAFLKAMGVKSGVADYMVLSEGFTGFIEFKKPKGRQTQTQKEFQQSVESFNMSYELAYSVSDGLDILQRWGLLL
jgi:hypothetical protein